MSNFLGAVVPCSREVTLFRFYRKEFTPQCAIPELTPGFEAILWRPGQGRMVPFGCPLFPFLVWWAFHHLRIFTNRDYGVLLIVHHRKLVHRSLVTPRYFKFPFMATDDLQIGDTWTDPAFRGRGLAGCAIGEIGQRLGARSRAFWYVVHDENAASIKVVERLQFALVGRGHKQAPFRLPLLGRYAIDERHKQTTE